MQFHINEGIEDFELSLGFIIHQTNPQGDTK